MAEIALIDIGPFDLDTGERLGFGYHGAQGVAVIGPPMKGLGMVVVIETLQPNS